MVIRKVSLNISVALVIEFSFQSHFIKSLAKKKNARLNIIISIKMKKERKLKNINIPVIFGAQNKEEC